MEAYRKATHPDERLVYFNDRPYSAQFYMQGKAVQLTGIPELQAALTETNHDFYVVKDEVMVSLPEAAKLRLEPVKRYHLFTLFHARSLDGR